VGINLFIFRRAGEEEMPFIHAASLPFETPQDILFLVEGISKDFARDSGIALEHVTDTWEYMLPGSYDASSVGYDTDHGNLGRSNLT
jgi:hypothetical protein